MTNYASQYNFMDLLRDNGVKKLAHLRSAPPTTIYEGLVDQLSSRIELLHKPHDVKARR